MAHIKLLEHSYLRRFYLSAAHQQKYRTCRHVCLFTSHRYIIFTRHVSNKTPGYTNLPCRVVVLCSVSSLLCQGRSLRRRLRLDLTNFKIQNHSHSIFYFFSKFYKFIQNSIGHYILTCTHLQPINKHTHQYIVIYLHK